MQLDKQKILLIGNPNVGKSVVFFAAYRGEGYNIKLSGDNGGV